MEKNNNLTLSVEEASAIVARARKLEASQGEQKNLFKRYREMFFLDNVERPKNADVDKNDWKITADPSSRNEVMGLQRLFNTSEIHIKIKDGDDKASNSDEIERGLKRILDVSGEGKKARVEADAMLSAVLYGPVVLAADSIADLLTTKLPEYKKRYLQKKQKKSPFLIRVINAEDSFEERDEGMMTLHNWKYKLNGAAVRSRYGVTQKIDDTLMYEVRDIFTPEAHVVEVQGFGVVYAKKHNLGCVPIVSSFSGGSEMFSKPEEQIQSFLYAKAKSEMDKWGNSILTTMRTAMHIRGLLGPLVAVDTDTDRLSVNYVGGFRWIKGKAQPIDDKIIDPFIIQAKNLLDELSGQSTVYKQTLGESVGAGTPFSSLAMLSSAGKLPMVDGQRALQRAFGDIFDYILYRIKQGSIENEVIKPADIPDDYEIEVTIEPKLPQDSLRNAQVAAQLGPLVSDEWKHSNLLQIGDSAEMRKQVFKETIAGAMMKRISEDENFMQGILSQITGQQQQPPTPPTQPTPGGAMPMQQPMPTDPTGQMNMEQMPQTDPMIPPQERM